MDSKLLARRLRRSVMSYGARQVAVMALAVGSNIVLTRYVAPAQFGMLAVVAMVMSVATLLADGGLGVYLVQRHAEVTERDLHRVTTVQLYAALLLVLLCFAGATVAEALSAGGQVAWMVAASSLALPLLVVRGMALLRLERSLQIDRVVRLELLEQVVAAAVSIGLAIRGAGAWSIVVGQLCKAVLGSIYAISLGSFRYRPVPIAWDEDLRNGFRFGFHYQSAQLINMARVAVVPLFIIPVMGFQAGGFVERSWLLCSIPLSIVLAVQEKTLFPYVSRIQRDVEKVRGFAEDSIHVSALVDKLMFLPLLLLARELLLRLFGAQWLPMLPLVYWLLVGNVVFGSLPGTLYAVANGLGKSEYVFRLNLYTLIGSWILIVSCTLAFGIVGVGVAGLVLWGLTFWLRERLRAEIGKFPFYRQNAKPLLAFALAWGCMELLLRATNGRAASLPGLAAWALLAAAAYAAVILAIDWTRIRALWTRFRAGEIGSAVPAA